jgi:hypothetical protein
MYAFFFKKKIRLGAVGIVQIRRGFNSKALVAQQDGDSKVMTYHMLLV